MQRIGKLSTGFWDSKHKTFVFIFTIVIVLGIFFRFVNIDRKAYWFDETFTSLRVSGYTEYEFVEQVSQAGLISQKELEKFQRINSEKNIIDTIKSLAIEEPQHPPLYYIVTRIWVQLFGNSVTSIRTVSAFISLIALPSMYWLCQELFSSTLTAQIAVAFIAISPLHILYAQQAREYSLWTVMTLLTSAVLLYAMRLNTRFAWGIHTAAVITSLYTFPGSIAVTFAQAIYLAIMENFRLTKKLIAYLSTLIIALIIFLPWLLVIITSLKHIDQTIVGHYHPHKASLLKAWAFNLSRIFIDSNHSRTLIYFGFENSFTFLIEIVLVCLIVILSVYSLYFICRHSSRQSWLYIIVLIFLTAFTIMIEDLIDGESKSMYPRYIIPAYLFIQISIAHVLAESIIGESYRRKTAKIIICLLLSGSIISCVTVSQASSWWTQNTGYDYSSAAQLINKFDKPLIISSDSMGSVISLNYQLKSPTMFNLIPDCYTCRFTPPVNGDKKIFPIPEAFDVVLFNPSPKLIQDVKAYPVYNINPIGLNMWHLTQKINKSESY